MTRGEPAQNGLGREGGEQSVPFGDQCLSFYLQIGECLLESRDVAGRQTRLFAIDVVADGGVTLRVLIDRAVVLEFGSHLTCLLLELGDLLVVPKQPSMNPFQTGLSVSPGVAYSLHRPYTCTAASLNAQDVAGVTELADVPDSKSGDPLDRVGSSPTSGTDERYRQPPLRTAMIDVMTRQAILPDRVFDSVTGVMAENKAVIIEDGMIISVESWAAAENPTRLEGITILPGLIDVHTHLAMPLDDGQGFASMVTRNSADDALIGVKHAGETIRAGFTTVRDLGCWRAFTDVALRDAIDAGWVTGPRMACAGAFVTSPGGGGDITGLAVDVDEVLPKELRFGVTSGVDQMRSNIKQILRYGADFIKILATGAVLTEGTNPGAPEFTEDELVAAVETTAEAGTYVAAHAHGTEGIKRAVRAGVRSIEHGSLLDDEAIELMVENGTFLVADLYDGDYILENGPAMGYSQEVLRKTEMTNDAQRLGFTKALDSGVKVAYGTDAAVYPHGNNAVQLPYYVKYGLTAAQAIQSATRWAAELMGWEDQVGSLNPGTHADLIGVRGNPLDDVAILGEVSAVMKGGEWVVAP